MLFDDLLAVPTLLILSAFALSCDAAALLEKRFGTATAVTGTQAPPPPCINGLARRGGNCQTTVATTFTVLPPPADPNIMAYNGYGRVMADPINIYAIYYGPFASSTITIVANFIQGFPGSNWWGTVRKYYESDSNAPGGIRNVSDVITYKGFHQDTAEAFGKDVTSYIPDIIANAISAEQWPADPNGIYLVILSGGVKALDQCVKFCGYHETFQYHNSSSIVNVKYAVAVDGSKCPNQFCLQDKYKNSGDQTGSINKDLTADSIVAMLAHEITEAATDSDVGTWTDGYGREAADRCSGNWGAVTGTAANSYNVDFGAFGKYLIQTIWSPVTQQCVIQ